MAGILVFLTCSLSFVIFLGQCGYVMELNLERTVLTYQNPKYVENGKTFVRRLRRGSRYVASLEGIVKVTLGNNASLDLVFHEFLNNQFKRSFLEMKFKLCDFLNNDPYIGKMFADKVKCPVVPGEYHLMNITADLPSLQNFAYKVPFHRVKVAARCYFYDINDTIFELDLIASLNQRAKQLQH